VWGLLDQLNEYKIFINSFAAPRNFELLINTISTDYQVPDSDENK
jgi:hypothetical protein